MKKIIVQCDACGGTGLYQGLGEANGTAVICVQCGGQGWDEIRYVEFTGRKRRTGIKLVSQSRGAFIPTGVGAVGKLMTYAEFEMKFPSCMQAKEK